MSKDTFTRAEKNYYKAQDTRITNNSDFARNVELFWEKLRTAVQTKDFSEIPQQIDNFYVLWEKTENVGEPGVDDTGVMNLSQLLQENPSPDLENESFREIISDALDELNNFNQWALNRTGGGADFWDLPEETKSKWN